jgi:hypothetical protein
MLIISACAAQSQTAHAPVRRLPKLSGAISDSNKTPIRHAEVQLTGKNGQLKSETNDDGRYSLQLPAGEYFLSISATGYCDFHQHLSIASDTLSVSENFILMDCSDCPRMDVDFVEPNIGLDGTAPNLPDFSKLPSMKYQMDDLKVDSASSKSKRTLLYGRRDASGDAMEYVGLFCPGHDKPPIFIFDGGNIRADKFTYSKDKMILRGVGNVVVADYRGISRVGVVEIRLAETPVKVSLTN